MSASKKRALHHRLRFVARAASDSRLLTGYAGFPPSNSRIIVRLEKEGLIARTRQLNSLRTTRTIFVATDKGRAALAAAGMEPSGELPGTGELREPKSKENLSFRMLPKAPKIEKASDTQMDSNQTKAYLANEFAKETKRISELTRSHPDVALPFPTVAVSHNQSWMTQEGNVSLALRQGEAQAIAVALRSGNPPEVKFSEEALWLHKVREKTGERHDATAEQPDHQNVIFIPESMRRDGPPQLKDRETVQASPEVLAEIFLLEKGSTSRLLSSAGKLIYENPELISGYEKGKGLGQVGEIAASGRKLGYVSIDPQAIIKAVDNQKNPDRFAKTFKIAAMETVSIKTGRAEELRQALPKVIAAAEARSKAATLAPKNIGPER